MCIEMIDFNKERKPECIQLFEINKEWAAWAGKLARLAGWADIWLAGLALYVY